MNTTIKNKFQAECLYWMLSPVYARFRAGLITEGELSYLDWAEAQLEMWV